MQSRKFVLAVALIGAAMTTVPAAVAAESAGTWYLGAGAGQAQAKIEDLSVNAALFGTGAIATATAKSEHSFEYKAFIGYQFNNYFAVEGGYFNLGKFSLNSMTSPAGALHGDLKNNRGWNLDLVGILPMVADRFSLLGRVGVQSSKTSDLFVGAGAAAAPANPAPSKNRVNYKLGLGAEFDFTKNVGVRGEWERYRISDGFSGNADVNVFSASLLYKF